MIEQTKLINLYFIMKYILKDFDKLNKVNIKCQSKKVLDKT